MLTTISTNCNDVPSQVGLTLAKQYDDDTVTDTLWPAIVVYIGALNARQTSPPTYSFQSGLQLNSLSTMSNTYRLTST